MPGPDRASLSSPSTGTKKVQTVAPAALQQIADKAYARRFAGDKRKLFKIGVRFSTENRCIEDWKVYICQ